MNLLDPPAILVHAYPATLGAHFVRNTPNVLLPQNRAQWLRHFADNRLHLLDLARHKIVTKPARRTSTRSFSHRLVDRVATRVTNPEICT